MNEKPKQAAIIGGRGKEGMRWGEILKANGWMVHIVDKGDPTAIISECSLVVLAISWRNIKDMSDIITLIKPGTLCVSAMGRMSQNAFALKGKEGKGVIYLCQLLLEKKVEIAFVHFMYSSVMKDGRGQNAAVNDSHCSLPNSQLLGELVASTGVTRVPVERERHDEVAAFIQKMIREFAFMFAHAALAKGISLQEMYSLSTPPSRAFLAMVCRVLLQPPALNEEIVLDLPSVPYSLLAFATLRCFESQKRQEERGVLSGTSSSAQFAEFFGKVRTFAQDDLAAMIAGALT